MNNNTYQAITILLESIRSLCVMLALSPDKN